MGMGICSPLPEDQTTPRPFLNLEGGGGGQRGDGFHINVQGRENIWTSDNKRHEVDLYGKYGQHYGGPGGTSPARHEFGTIYTYRFPNF
ncbi:diptericin A-like [Drosophila tropicalis]|uniref:diptericin A-like n=1 Tax=Drosophila tropicalis TaxID=46794 RepID=UPI0035AB7CDF